MKKEGRHSKSHCLMPKNITLKCSEMLYTDGEMFTLAPVPVHCYEGPEKGKEGPKALVVSNRVFPGKAERAERLLPRNP